MNHSGIPLKLRHFPSLHRSDRHALPVRRAGENPFALGGSFVASGEVAEEKPSALYSDIHKKLYQLEYRRIQYGK